MNKKVSIWGILIVILVCSLLFIVGFKTLTRSEIKDVYRVYLDGKVIGLIENKDELLNLIDNAQEEIKVKYGVDKVYPPEGLDIVKFKTYNGALNSVQDIYNIIEEKSNFTIPGYTVTIRPTEGEARYINFLNKEDLEPALINAISAFIPTENLHAYLNNSQVEIVDTGKLIRNIYFDEKITIKQRYLNVDDEIILNASDLTKFLLFGTLEKQEEYTVKSGDTVESVAFDNKLSNEELLIANPSIGSVNSLLSTGQVLNIGLIKPMFTVNEVSDVVEDVVARFSTVYENDANRYPSESFVRQEGEDGIIRVNEQVTRKNGDIVKMDSGNQTYIKMPVNKVVVKGTKVSYNYIFSNYPPAVSGTDWGWPTISPYTITSYFGYRWGKYHGALDISTGIHIGTPVYSSTDGEVIFTYNKCANNGYYGSTCGGGYGNAVNVASDNGYTIIYGHMMNDIKVKVGDRVSKGQLIGYLGNSGSSTGPHLHFEIKDSANNKVNPCRVAFKC